MQNLINKLNIQMLNKKLQQDDAIFKSLDLKTINRLICYTDKGILTLQIRKGDIQYHLCLDSVPLDKKLNDELMTVLFPKKELEIPQVNKSPIIEKKYLDINEVQIPLPKILNGIIQPMSVEIVPKSKGRPKGSKNR